MEEKVMNKRFDIYYCDATKDRKVFFKTWENLYYKGGELNAANIYSDVFNKDEYKLFRPAFKFAYANYRNKMSDEEITHAIEVLINCGYFEKFDNKTIVFKPEGKKELINAFLDEKENA